MSQTKGERVSPTAQESLKDAKSIKRQTIDTGVYDVVRILQRGHTYKMSIPCGYKVYVPIFEVKGYDYG
jgi:hypothetical protein